MGSTNHDRLLISLVYLICHLIFLLFVYISHLFLPEPPRWSYDMYFCLIQEVNIWLVGVRSLKPVKDDVIT